MRLSLHPAIINEIYAEQPDNLLGNHQVIVVLCQLATSARRVGYWPHAALLNASFFAWFSMPLSKFQPRGHLRHPWVTTLHTHVLFSNLGISYMKYYNMYLKNIQNDMSEANITRAKE